MKAKKNNRLSRSLLGNRVACFLLLPLAFCLSPFLIGCGSLSESSMLMPGADGGAGGGADAGGGMGDAGSGGTDAGAASDSGGGNQDSGTPYDAGMGDGGPGSDASHGPACLDTSDCAWGEVCRGGHCGKPSWDGGTAADAGSGDAGGAPDAASDAGAADGGTVADAGTSCPNRCPGAIAGQSACDGPDEFRTCEPSGTDGCYSWSDPTGCGSSAGCSGGTCVLCNPAAAQEAESCDPASKPCDCGLECATLPYRPESRACHVRCGYFAACAPAQECAGTTAADEVCVGAAAGEGPFSCTAYPAGVSPEPDDPPGIASVRFSLSGRDYSFAYCLGDVEHVAGPEGSVWTVTLADYTEAAAGIEYRYVLGVAGFEHIVGGHAISAIGPVWADIYMFVTGAQGVVTRAVWLGYAVGGSVALLQIGDGATLATNGTLEPTVHYETSEVICDNADPDPARHCPE
ncbi:MAG: hypothetical protein HY897_01865 [Deltaproteobacteria bacterium]|nr:hypothetical protein [Deltaproteobacteria bacterium]